MPRLLAQYMPNLPRAINGTADLLQLPVYNTSSSIYSGIDVGDGKFPGPYNRDQFKANNRPRFYAADTWKVTPALTINAALAYEFETGLWYDLPFPAFLAPIIGSNNLSAPPVNYTQFAPQIGFAWGIGSDKKTVNSRRRRYVLGQ